MLAMADAGNRSLADLLALGRPAQTATLILITSTLDPAWVAAVGRPRRGGNAMVLLVDPTEFGSPVDQGKVTTALARTGIPFTRIPRSLLEDAYPSLAHTNQKRPSRVETGKRYFRQEKATWQSMD
jgi:hypothetical protein